MIKKSVRFMVQGMNEAAAIQQENAAAHVVVGVRI